MKLKIFTFRFSPTEDGFNDKPMQEFIADKEVIEFTEHFFIHDKTPYLTVLLSYRDLPWDAKRKLGGGQEAEKRISAYLDEKLSLKLKSDEILLMRCVYGFTVCAKASALVPVLFRLLAGQI